METVTQEKTILDKDLLSESLFGQKTSEKLIDDYSIKIGKNKYLTEWIETTLNERLKKRDASGFKKGPPVQSIKSGDPQSIETFQKCALDMETKFDMGIRVKIRSFVNTFIEVMSKVIDQITERIKIFFDGEKETANRIELMVHVGIIHYEANDDMHVMITIHYGDLKLV